MKLVLKDLPPLSPLASRLLDFDLERADAEARLLQVIESDPALGARLLAVANSAAMASPGARYTTINAALRRIGLRRALHVATSLLFVGTLGQALSSSLNRALWLHALAVAFAAQALADMKRLPEPNAAYFVGLTHDIGYMAMEYVSPGILSDVAREVTEANVSQEQAEFRLLGMEHAEVAAQMLELWGVPAELVAPVRTHHALDCAPDSLAAILFGAEKLARSAEIVEPLYAGFDHPFAPLAIDRLGIEFLFEQQLELDSSAVDVLTARIIDQVAGLREAAVLISQ